MKKSIVYFVGIIALIFTSCYKENQTAQQLGGKWKIVSFTGKPTDLAGVIMPDSLEQTFTFKECKNAYTANCRCFYEIQMNDTTHIEADLMYTLKGDELDFIGVYSGTAKWIQQRQNLPDSVRVLKQGGTSQVPLMSAIPNYLRLYGAKRYFIRELNEGQSFMFERFKDSLQVRANYIGN